MAPIHAARRGTMPRVSPRRRNHRARTIQASGSTANHTPHSANLSTDPSNSPRTQGPLGVWTTHRPVSSAYAKAGYEVTLRPLAPKLKAYRANGEAAKVSTPNTSIGTHEPRTCARAVTRNPSVPESSARASARRSAAAPSPASPAVPIPYPLHAAPGQRGGHA